MLTGESRFHLSTPLGWTQVPHDGKLTSGPLDQWNCVWAVQALHRAPPQQPTMSVVKPEGGSNQDRRAVWDQVGLSHCWHDGLVMVRGEARLRQGHNDHSRRGHQCSETTLTGESQFHISTPLGIEHRSLMTGSKRVDHWTSGTVCECSEIAGSSQTSVCFL